MRRPGDGWSEVEALYADALALASQRRYDEAAAAFRQMLERIAAPASSAPRKRGGVAAGPPNLLRDAHIGLGRCYAEMGRLQEAADELSAGTAEGLGDADALGRLADVQVRMGRMLAAAATLARADGIDPRALQVKIAQGNYWLAAEDYDQALACWTEAVRSLPAGDLRFAEAVLAFLDRDQPHAAVALSRAAVDAAPGEVRRCLHLVRVLYTVGQVSDARDAIQAAAEQFPGDVEVLSALAQTLLALGDAQAAEGVCATLRAIAPQSPGTLMYSTAAAQRLGHSPEALEYATGLVRVSPLDPYAHYQLGTLQQETGDLVGAMRRYATAASLAAYTDEDLVTAIGEAMQRLDTIQIQQVVTLAAENVVFRTRLRRDPQRTLHDYGFELTDAAAMMLQSVDVSDLPRMLGNRDRRMSH